MNRKNKEPTAKIRIESNKEPRLRAKADPNNIKEMPPVWSYLKCDIGGPWCLSKIETEHLLDLLQHLKNFEGMTWGEIEGGNHHFSDVESMISEAKNRLQEIFNDDISELFSFKINNLRRLWGRRRDDVFEILWWDPEHRIYPSQNPRFNNRRRRSSRR